MAALDLPEDVPAYEADKWVLSEVIGFRPGGSSLTMLVSRSP